MWGGGGWGSLVEVEGGGIMAATGFVSVVGWSSSSSNSIAEGDAPKSTDCATANQSTDDADLAKSSLCVVWNEGNQTKSQTLCRSGR